MSKNQAVSKATDASDPNNGDGNKEFILEIAKATKVIQDRIGYIQAQIKQFNDYEKILDTIQSSDTDSVLAQRSENLFHDARLVTKDTVLADIGAGYFVERSVSNQIKYYRRKSKLLADYLQAELKDFVKLDSLLNQYQTATPKVMA